jgi:hypothetical protein
LLAWIGAAEPEDIARAEPTKTNARTIASGLMLFLPDQGVAGLRSRRRRALQPERCSSLRKSALQDCSLVPGRRPNLKRRESCQGCPHCQNYVCSATVPSWPCEVSAGLYVDASIRIFSQVGSDLKSSRMPASKESSIVGRGPDVVLLTSTAAMDNGQAGW